MLKAHARVEMHEAVAEAMVPEAGAQSGLLEAEILLAYNTLYTDGARRKARHVSGRTGGRGGGEYYKYAARQRDQPEHRSLAAIGSNVKRCKTVTIFVAHASALGGAAPEQGWVELQRSSHLLGSTTARQSFTKKIWSI